VITTAIDADPGTCRHCCVRRLRDLLPLYLWMCEHCGAFVTKAGQPDPDTEAQAYPAGADRPSPSDPGPDCATRRAAVAAMEQYGPIVTINARGSVIRWYRDLRSAEQGDALMVATRLGVLIYVYTHEVPISAQLDAQCAYRGYLREGVATTAEYALATHHRPDPAGPLIPVEWPDGRRGSLRLVDTAAE
jgi:hypothetical protein